ncbi:hypothetical protein MMC24_007045 [Lignoscripta atroalba]|nr:hypothetical protein [Lignoscripta atroalba]
MDLVAGVRKEGSRGGRDSFKWEDVKDNQHRENYLGHSLMAPVGRWQKNKDLSWYAKGDDSQAAQDAAAARAEEIRRIKEAEQDALSAALGFAVEPRIRDSQLAGSREVEKAIKETAESDEDGGKGVGFGAYVRPGEEGEGSRERMMGYIGEKGGLAGGDIKKDQRRRSISRDREEKQRRHRGHKETHHKSHRRHRSRSRERTTRRRSRSRSYERRRDDGRYPKKYKERSYSPERRRRDRYQDDRLERRR